jgi:hypothetical protein
MFLRKWRSEVLGNLAKNRGIKVRALTKLLTERRRNRAESYAIESLS